MATNTTTPPNSSRGGKPQMDMQLVEAASCGNFALIKELALSNPSILLGTTPQGNNCIHIASIHGHLEFCRDVLEMEESLLSNFNLEWESPLSISISLGHVPLALYLLEHCSERRLSQTILQQDIYGFNALHHAIRNGQKDLALKLIKTEPMLSQAMTNYNESPMFIAVMRDYTDVFEELLRIPNSFDKGKYARNALHAAARNGNSDIAKMIMEKRSWLVGEPDMAGNTPIMLAIIYAKVDVVGVLLEHDNSSGYRINNQGYPLLCRAAALGHVGVAKKILMHCPDALYRCVYNQCYTCLHEAVNGGHTDFVRFILKTPQLRKVINMQDSLGKTALHYAVRMCNPKMVDALLRHKDIDTSVLDNNAISAARELSSNMHHVKTLNWNEVVMLMSKSDPQDATAVHNLHVEAKRRATYESRKDAKSLTQTYTTNTSLVAILITTITFAAAFTLPGGYDSSPGSEGLPVMFQKASFKAFLISDTLAMCSSFVVAFICIIARWEDYEFLLYYRSFTKKLMWFAYMATTMAFSTGLYTVLAPRLHWLAIAICVLVAFLPIVTKLLGNWPVLKLRFRLGKSFRPDLLNMV